MNNKRLEDRIKAKMQQVTSLLQPLSSLEFPWASDTFAVLATPVYEVWWDDNKWFSIEWIVVKRYRLSELELDRISSAVKTAFQLDRPPRIYNESIAISMDMTLNDARRLFSEDQSLIQAIETRMKKVKGR